MVPARELGRPRVDIVIASAAEGMFNNVTRLMDEAVQRVKVLEEAENFVRRHYLATKAALMDRGYAEEDAERRTRAASRRPCEASTARARRWWSPTRGTPASRR